MPLGLGDCPLANFLRRTDVVLASQVLRRQKGKTCRQEQTSTTSEEAARVLYEKAHTSRSLAERHAVPTLLTELIEEGTSRLHAYE